MAKSNLMLHTVVGTLFSVSYVSFHDIVKSALLAAVGATVSLIVSLLLRYLIRKLHERFKSG